MLAADIPLVIASAAVVTTAAAAQTAKPVKLDPDRRSTSEQKERPAAEYLDTLRRLR